MKFCFIGSTVILKNGNMYLFTTVLENIRVYGICLFDLAIRYLVMILNAELQSLQLKNLTSQRNGD